MTREDKKTLSLVILFMLTLVFVAFLPNSKPPQTEVYYESHIVEQGETLSGIVEEYGGSFEKTKALNPGNVIMPGEKLTVVVEVER